MGFWPPYCGLESHSLRHSDSKWSENPCKSHKNTTNKAIIETRNKILIFISKEIFMDKQWVEMKAAEHKKKIEAEKAELYE